MAVFLCLFSQFNSIKKQPKHEGTSSCFGNWKFLVPSFLLRSWSNDPKKEKKKKQGISGNGFEKLQVHMNAKFKIVCDYILISPTMIICNVCFFFPIVLCNVCFIVR